MLLAKKKETCMTAVCTSMDFQQRREQLCFLFRSSSIPLFQGVLQEVASLELKQWSQCLLQIESWKTLGHHHAQVQEVPAFSWRVGSSPCGANQSQINKQSQCFSSPRSECYDQKEDAMLKLAADTLTCIAQHYVGEIKEEAGIKVHNYGGLLIIWSDESLPTLLVSVLCLSLETQPVFSGIAKLIYACSSFPQRLCAQLVSFDWLGEYLISLQIKTLPFCSAPAYAFQVSLLVIKIMFMHDVCLQV